MLALKPQCAVHGGITTTYVLVVSRSPFVASQLCIQLDTTKIV